jgi:hypothetical protein
MEENGFVERLISVEATFPDQWQSEQTQCPYLRNRLHAQIEHQHDSSKVNVFYEVSREKVRGQFFFTVGIGQSAW